MPRSLEYRPEIDGLRAVAVLSVILFHGELALPGGFLGVDVFFVISGYLISAILIDEYDRSGRISIADFYERRIRRILPALTATCLATLPIAYFLLLPDAFVNFRQSLLATLLFVANIFFWNDTGYFAAAAETKPLLHMWSLAVEEQYYLVFPLLVLFVRKNGTANLLLIIVLAGFLASLALAYWGFVNMRSAAFYLTPFRVWELFAGVLAALVYNRFQVASPAVRATLSWVGVALIIGPMVAYDPLDQYAVPAMQSVVAGGFLVIMFSAGTGAGRILSSSGFVMIGKISFSAYLVHQPVFVFARIMAPTGLSLWWEIALAIFALGLGWLSWKFVEQPFRNRNNVDRRSLLKTASVVIASLVSVIAVSLLVKLPQKWSDQVLTLEQVVSAGTYGLSPACKSGWRSPECQFGENPQVLLWGDSYAMHLAYGLKAANVPFRQAALPSCPARAHPAYLEPSGNGYQAACARFNNAVVAFIQEQARAGRLQTVIISSRDYGIRGGTLRKFPKEAPVDRKATFEQLDATIVALQAMGVRVGLVGAPPAATFDPGQCVLKSAAFGAPVEDCQFPLLANAKGGELEQIASARNVSLLNLAPYLCDGGICRPTDDGVLLYRDNGHLTPEGSVRVFTSAEGRKFLNSLMIEYQVDKR